MPSAPDGAGSQPSRHAAARAPRARPSAEPRRPAADAGHAVGRSRRDRRGAAQAPAPWQPRRQAPPQAADAEQAEIVREAEEPALGDEAPPQHAIRRRSASTRQVPMAPWCRRRSAPAAPQLQRPRSAPRRGCGTPHRARWRLRRRLRPVRASAISSAAAAPRSRPGRRRAAPIEPPRRRTAAVEPVVPVRGCRRRPTQPGRPSGTKQPPIRVGGWPPTTTERRGPSRRSLERRQAARAADGQAHAGVGRPSSA